MEELFEQLKSKIQEGSIFFDLIADLIKEMDDAGFKTNVGQLKNIRLNIATGIEIQVIQLIKALKKVGYSNDEAESKTLDFVEALFNFPCLPPPLKDL